MGKIEDQIPVDLKSAMLAKDKVKLAALRAVKSAFLLEKTIEKVIWDFAWKSISKFRNLQGCLRDWTPQKIPNFGW